MSSGSPSQIVYEVGGERARNAEQPPDRLAAELPADVVQRPVERGLRRLPWDLREACADLLECERVVAEQVARRLEARTADSMLSP